MIHFTRHALLRSAQWNLSREEIDYIFVHGIRMRKAGALIFFLRKRDIPEWDRLDDRWMRLAGTAVILTKDGRRVITVWRNQKYGLKRIKCKPKSMRSEEQTGWKY